MLFFLLPQGNDEFTDILKTEMVNNDVQGISTSNLKATTTSGNIVVDGDDDASVESKTPTAQQKAIGAVVESAVDKAKDQN